MFLFKKFSFLAGGNSTEKKPNLDNVLYIKVGCNEIWNVVIPFHVFCSYQMMDVEMWKMYEKKSRMFKIQSTFEFFCNNVGFFFFYR